MLTHTPEVIRLLHRERMEQLARAARRRPATEQLTEQQRLAHIALHVRQRRLRLREDT